MKKFKLFMAIAVVFTATFMTGCEKPKDDVKENTEQKQEENTVAQTLGRQFESEIENERDIEKVTKKIAENEILEISVDASQVKSGDYLSGFQKEIKDFKNAYVIRPMIGTIPFIAYIFEVENSSEFAEELKSSADLRWNICTEADEMHVVVRGDYVFFVMSPKNFEQEE
ncbi:MAG: hypothetical protein HFI73_03685 [Bacilli bacterium]|jgi:hypothetical protein|nr:hypothetical protein [Bacilli bacterium]